MMSNKGQIETTQDKLNAMSHEILREVGSDFIKKLKQVKDSNPGTFLQPSEERL